MAREHDVELIFFSDCPHAAVARTNLEIALRQVGLSSTWREWDLQDPAIPSRAVGYASPTVLVDGEDVSGQGPSVSEGTLSCRAEGAPTVPQIAVALSSE